MQHHKNENPPAGENGNRNHRPTNGNGGGKLMEQNYIRRIFKKILVKAGIRKMRLHDIRHTFASLLLSRGESPVYVKEQLGHSSIQMTVDIYGHLIPGSNRGAVNQLDSPQQSATYQNRKAVTQ